MNMNDSNTLGRLIYLFIYLGFICLNSRVTANEPENYVLTIETAKKIALERSLNLAAKKEQVEVSHSLQGRATSKFYPTLESKLGSEQGLTGKNEQASTFGYLAARWNIYRGGLDVTATRTASLETKRIEFEYEMERFAVETTVEEIFSKIIYLRDICRIKERYIEINTQQQALARQVVARGGGSQSDVIEFEMRLATLKSELAQMEQEYQAAFIKLKLILGEKLTAQPSPTGELQHQHLKGQLADYVNQTLVETPQIKLATLDFDIANHKLTAAKGRWLPQVDVEGRFGSLPASDAGASGKLGSSVALVATWEIFGGFDASYEVREKLSEKAQADWQLKASIQTLLADLETQFSELTTLQKRADLEKNNVRTAKKFYDLVFADFKRGYKNSGDFIDAAQAWYDAEIQRKKLDLEFVEKKLYLEKQLGKRIISNPMKDLDDDEKEKHAP